VFFQQTTWGFSNGGATGVATHFLLFIHFHDLFGQKGPCQDQSRQNHQNGIIWLGGWMRSLVTKSASLICNNSSLSSRWDEDLTLPEVVHAQL
jgi:hypothetical protein